MERTHFGMLAVAITVGLLLGACDEGGGGNDSGAGTGSSTETSSQVSARGGSDDTGDKGLIVLAETDGGTLWALGSNEFGELGFDPANTSVLPEPQQIGTAMDWEAAWMGHSHALGLKADGTLWAWGEGLSGALGNGATDQTHVPVQVCAAECDGYLTGVIAAGLGGYSTASSCCSKDALTAASESLSLASSSDAWSVALLDDGTVWAWGDGSVGQLGDGCDVSGGTCGAVSAPTQVCETHDGETCLSPLGDVIALGAGDYHAVALKADGTVWAWGYNNDGELGRGATTTGESLAQPVCTAYVDGSCTALLEGVTQIAVGNYHTLALLDDGSVWAWGYNGEGELGNGTDSGGKRVAAEPLAAPVCTAHDGSACTAFLTDASAIAAGSYHSFAIRGGNLWAWGANGGGQLGTGGNGNFDFFDAVANGLLPEQVGTATGWTPRIAGGDWQTLAIKDDESVWAWGWNFRGGLGRGVADSSGPVPVLGTGGTAPETDWSAMLAAGDDHSVALKNDGTLRAWGLNRNAQLGTAPRYSHNAPAPSGDAGGDLTPDGDWVMIAAGVFHTLGLKSDGTVWAWGQNTDRQLGTGDGSVYGGIVPVCETGSIGGGDCIQLGGVDSVAAGHRHSFAITDAGSLLAWGQNTNGQLGFDSSGTDVGNPTAVTAPVDGTWVAVDGGEAHSVGVVEEAEQLSFWAWGINSSGQLGTGDTTQSSVPVAVCLEYADGVCTTDFTDAIDVISLSVGRSHTLVGMTDGTAWAWGSNTFGQLGDGTTTSPAVSPQQVCGAGGCADFLDNVSIVAAGGAHSLALLTDGTLLAWGNGTFGELGDGCTLDVDCAQATLPQQVGATGEWSAAAAGFRHNLARKTDGNLWAWGENTYGMLGDGRAFSDVPVRLGP